MNRAVHQNSKSTNEERVGAHEASPSTAAQQRAGIMLLLWNLYQLIVPHRTRILYWAYRRRRKEASNERAQMRDVQLIRACQAELKQIVSQHPDAKGVIIFSPSIDWDTPLFQRPQQMALAFASLGYLVLYSIHMDSPSSVSRFDKVRDGLYLCRVPVTVYDVIEHPAVIAYSYSYPWVRRLKSASIVYEMIDHLEIFSDHPFFLVKWYHVRLMRMAAVVVGSATELLSALIRHRPDAILCPNGVDVNHFAGEDHRLETPEDMRQLVVESKPIIGYYGALAEWFDFDLLKHAAKALPDYTFVLIGPDYDGQGIRDSGIAEVSNIHWLGPKSYKELPEYLHVFDVATIPFAVTEALQAVSPIKLFEYMAGGRPIVTTDLVECRKYPVVRIARTRDEWVEQLREAVRLRHDADYIGELRRTASENTWTQRAEQIIAVLEAREYRQGNTSGLRVTGQQSPTAGLSR